MVRPVVSETFQWDSGIAVRALHEALTLLVPEPNLDSEDVTNGVFGPSTRVALLAWQTDTENDVPVPARNGILNEATAIRINNALLLLDYDDANPTWSVDQHSAVAGADFYTRVRGGIGFVPDATIPGQTELPGPIADGTVVRVFRHGPRELVLVAETSVSGGGAFEVPIPRVPDGMRQRYVLTVHGERDDMTGELGAFMHESDEISSRELGEIALNVWHTTAEAAHETRGSVFHHGYFLVYWMEAQQAAAPVPGEAPNASLGELGAAEVHAFADELPLSLSGATSITVAATLALTFTERLGAVQVGYDGLPFYRHETGNWYKVLFALLSDDEGATGHANWGEALDAAVTIAGPGVESVERLVNDAATFVFSLPEQQIRDRLADASAQGILPLPDSSTWMSPEQGIGESLDTVVSEFLEEGAAWRLSGLTFNDALRPGEHVVMLSDLVDRMDPQIAASRYNDVAAAWLEAGGGVGSVQPPSAFWQQLSDAHGFSEQEVDELAGIFALSEIAFHHLGLLDEILADPSVAAGAPSVVATWAAQKWTTLFASLDDFPESPAPGETDYAAELVARAATAFPSASHASFLLWIRTQLNDADETQFTGSALTALELAREVSEDFSELAVAVAELSPESLAHARDFEILLDQADAPQWDAQSPGTKARTLELLADLQRLLLSTKVMDGFATGPFRGALFLLLRGSRSAKDVTESLEPITASPTPIQTMFTSVVSDLDAFDAMTSNPTVVGDVRDRAQAVAHASSTIASEVALGQASITQEASTARYEPTPNWPAMFGSVDYCECIHCNSITSPAAYLVDLLDWMKTLPSGIENGDAPGPISAANHALESSGWGDDEWTTPTTMHELLVRYRPEIERIALNCTNTETEVPSIDIANELLERAMREVFEEIGHVDEDATQTDTLIETTRVASEVRAYPDRVDRALYAELAKRQEDYFARARLDLSWEESTEYLALLGVDRAQVARSRTQIVTNDDEKVLPVVRGRHVSPSDYEYLRTTTGQEL